MLHLNLKQQLDKIHQHKPK